MQASFYAPNLRNIFDETFTFLRFFLYDFLYSFKFQCLFHVHTPANDKGQNNLMPHFISIKIRNNLQIVSPEIKQ